MASSWDIGIGPLTESEGLEWLLDPEELDGVWRLGGFGAAADAGGMIR